MAGKAGGSSFNLRVDLLRKGCEFSFIQAIRLLRSFSSKSEVPDGKQSIGDENIRVRPELSLVFPASDIVKVEEIDDEKPRYLITATFLGLYGSSSPLPTFYTEDLLDEASEDMSASRDFIDIINHRIYILLYHSWLKYRTFIQVTEEKNLRDLERLFSFLGINEKELQKELTDPFALIRYAGLFTQFPRSSAGLETLLIDSLEGIPVQVLPCILRRVKIPPEQRLRLGTTESSLGVASFLGEEIDDRMGKFRLQIGPLTSNEFNSLLPGNANHDKIVFLTRFYTLDPLEFDLTLVLAEAEAKPVCLGAQQWSRLGWDTWTFAGDRMEEVRVTFPPHYN